MPRQTLDETHLHPAIRDRIAGYHNEVVQEVRAAIAANPVVVVGMTQNPHPKRARALLDAQKISYKYLEYGSYFKDWHRRLALKMWSGWSTFPMVFVKGTLIGGADDLKRLSDAGELQGLLK